MALAQELERRGPWVTSTAISVSIRNRPARSLSSLAKSTRRRPALDFNTTRDSTMDSTTPEQLALVVDVVEKHRILETHHGLAQLAHISARTLARRKAILMNTILICVLGISCAVVWSLVKDWCYRDLHARWAKHLLDAA
ncbi:hypothetical protein PG999_008252 [Apiospora kogelbergensis]|uniref:Uncharacterized protein n=1 Tax=Apiospora kogelbergensis TaxID=1337665 RepID=A0AAW0QK11_9PEZI